MAGRVCIAPYADVSAAIQQFGAMIGNPLVPTLLLASMQQHVVSQYGQFRTDAPFYVAAYDVSSNAIEKAVVYPAVDRIARMALASPGSERVAQDVLKFMPTVAEPDPRVAVFSDAGGYVAFAASPDIGRHALRDCTAGWTGERRSLLTLSLSQSGIRGVCDAGVKAGVTNVLGRVRQFAHVDLALYLHQDSLTLEFTAIRGKAAAQDLPEKLRGELLEAFTSRVGPGDRIVPEVTVTPYSETGKLTGRVVLSQQQLKALGRDFNGFVAEQMSGALKQSDEEKAGSGKPKKENEK